MRNSEADIAINTLNKLARKELDIVGDAIRDDYRNLKEAPLNPIPRLHHRQR